MTQELSFDAIGTSWQIGIENLPNDQLKQLSQTKLIDHTDQLDQPDQNDQTNQPNLLELNTLKNEIKTLIAEYDYWYSRFKLDSFITKVSVDSTKPGTKTYSLPNHSEPLFELYQALFELSDGLFTACIGHALEQTGYDAKYSLQPKNYIETSPSFELVDFSPAGKSKTQTSKTTKTKNTSLQHTENEPTHHPTLRIPHCTSALVLDFGAAGKGYLADLIGALISHKAPNATWLINAGGDILQRTAVAASLAVKPVTIGLEHPLDTTKIIGIAHIQNKSICGSAGNRRKWSTYHHILNPQTKTSPDHILATWVIAQSGLLADGLATALYFVSPEILQTKFDFEYVILYTNGTAHRSKNFTGHLYTQTLS